jgi:fluoride ion exporter CrcB/FEX
MIVNDSASNNEINRTLPNGFGAAAVLAAGIGSFALGVFTVAGDASKSFARHLILYRPTGPLSGVTTIAIAIWLLAWVFFSFRWRSRTVALRPVLTAAFLLLAASLLLTFPPVIDLF